MCTRQNLITILLWTPAALARTFTVKNSCPFTIWPAVFTDLNVGTSTPSVATGWEAPPSTSVNFSVPDDWKSGRIWARRNCDFSMPGPNSCLDGGCNGGLECDPHTGTGVPPASVAEWTLSGDGNRDFYDTSLVDGYNLPLRITNNVGCPIADCPVDLGPGCPDPLKGPFDNTGFPVGCRSACQANLDGDPTDSANCCSGSHNTPATCPPQGVSFYNYFKSNCPNSYVYAFDESSGTALWTCDAALEANYVLEFCPTVASSSNSAPPPNNPSNSALAATSLPNGVEVNTHPASGATGSVGLSASGTVGTGISSGSTTSVMTGVTGASTGSAGRLVGGTGGVWKWGVVMVGVGVGVGIGML